MTTSTPHVTVYFKLYTATLFVKDKKNQREIQEQNDQTDILVIYKGKCYYYYVFDILSTSPQFSD